MFIRYQTTLLQADPPFSSSVEGFNPDLYDRFTWESLLLAQPLAYHYFNFATRRQHCLTASYPEELLKVVICLNGQAKNRSSERSYTYQAGGVCIYKTLSSVSESVLESNQRYELLHLHFPLAKLADLVTDMPCLEPVLLENNVVRTCLTPAIQLLVRSLLQSPYQGALRSLHVENLLQQLLFEVLLTLDNSKAVASAAYPHGQKIREAKALLDQTTEFITIPMLAKRVGLNTDALKSGFKLNYQTTIFAYQQEQKLHRAHQLLRSGSSTVQEIAEACGYTSLGSFSNAFARQFGVRPSHVAKLPIR